MTWWEWALLIVWGPGTALALIFILGIGLHMIGGRDKHPHARP